MFYKRESYIVILTVVLWGLIAGINGNFAMPSFVLELIGYNSVYFICALGILPLMIMGDFDLSIGGVITSVSICLVAIHSIIALPLWLTFVAGGFIGMIFGLLNGYLIGIFRVSSVIVTLAMMHVHYGFARYIYRIMPESMRAVQSVSLASYQIAGFTVEHLLIGAVAVLTFYILRYRPLGRSVMAVGGDAGLAVRMGFDRFWTTIKVHGFCGLTAGLSAAAYMLAFGQASTEAYTGLAFELIIIVVIGGLNILGGYGSVIGTIASAMFIVVLKSGLVFARIPVFWHNMMIGMIIILVVSYDMYRHRSKLQKFGIRRVRA